MWLFDLAPLVSGNPFQFVLPEPSIWARLATGVGALGLTLRRRPARFFPGPLRTYARGRSPL